MPLSIAGIVAAVQQLPCLPLEEWNQLAFVFWVFIVSVPFHFFSFRRCSNNKSPQRWCSRIKQQIVLLGNGLHVFFASSGQKLASKGVWVKLWKTKAHANCSLKQKLWQKGSPHTKAEKHNLTLITNGKFQATCWWGNNYSRSRCIFVFDQPVVRCWQIWCSTLGRVLPTTCKLVL